jgi:hypothetical protein
MWDEPAIDLRTIARAFGTQTGLCRYSNRSVFAGANSAGKKFREAGDRGGIFGGTDRFRATRRRQESGIAQSCVVAEAVLIGPVSLFFSLLTQLSQLGRRFWNFVGES